MMMKPPYQRAADLRDQFPWLEIWYEHGLGFTTWYARPWGSTSVPMKAAGADDLVEQILDDPGCAALSKVSKKSE